LRYCRIALCQFGPGFSLSRIISLGDLLSNASQRSRRYRRIVRLLFALFCRPVVFVDLGRWSTFGAPFEYALQQIGVVSVVLRRRGSFSRLLCLGRQIRNSVECLSLFWFGTLGLVVQWHGDERLRSTAVDRHAKMGALYRMFHWNGSPPYAESIGSLRSYSLHQPENAKVISTLPSPYRCYRAEKVVDSQPDTHTLLSPRTRQERLSTATSTSFSYASTLVLMPFRKLDRYVRLSFSSFSDLKRM
jgi:hypothetical protein